MDIKAAKTKLIEISRSTGTKHSKVLISELCTVVRFLLDEIDRIKSPTLSVLSRRLHKGACLDPPRPLRTQPFPNEDFPKRFPTIPPISNDITAGDAT